MTTQSNQNKRSCVLLLVLVLMSFLSYAQTHCKLSLISVDETATSTKDGDGLCPEHTILSNIPNHNQGYVSSESYRINFQSYENMTYPVQGIYIWGLEASPVYEGEDVSFIQCDTDEMEIALNFFENIDGEPGELLESFLFTIAGIVDENIYFGNWTVKRYELFLEEPIILPDGWFSIYSTSTSSCHLGIISSTDDEGIAIYYDDDGNLVYWPNPLGFCLIGAVCQSPDTLAVCEISDYSASLSWSAIGNEVYWEVLKGESGFDPDHGGVLISEITDTILLLDQLVPESAYDIYMRSICGQDTVSDWSEVYSFATAFHTPYFQDFDADSDLPAGWQGDFEVHENRGVDGNNALSKLFGCEADTCITEAHFISPTLKLQNFTENQLVINYRIVDETGLPHYLIWSEQIVIEVSDDCGQSYTTIGTIDYTNHQSSSDYAEKVFDIPWINEFVTIRVRFAEASENDLFYIDINDFQVTPCYYKPLDLYADFIKDVDAELYWTSEGYEDQWDVAWGPVGFDPDEEGFMEEGVMGMPFFLEGLEPDTEYDFYVRANCGEDFVSDWAGPETFITQPECPEVWDVFVDQPDEFTIGLSWEPLGFESSWDVTFVQTGKGATERYAVRVYEPFVTFGDLPPGSNWQAIVIANCPCGGLGSEDCDYDGEPSPPIPCVVPELNEGGIFLHVRETNPASSVVAYVGYQYEVTWLDANGKVSHTSINTRGVSPVNGYAFLGPPSTSPNKRLDNDFLNEIILFDSNYNRVGSINFHYSFEWESMHTRNAIIFLHNDHEVCGGPPDYQHRYFPYHQDSPDNLFGKTYSYYQFGEYPVTMLIPPHFAANTVPNSNNEGYKFPHNYEGKKPLLFVHGLMGSFSYQKDTSPEYTANIGDQVSYWKHTERYVNHYDNDIHAWQFYYPGEDNLSLVAIMLRNAVNYLYPLYSDYGEKINIFTHSMGGLVTSEFLTTNTYSYNDQRIGKVLLSMPPLHGSIAANRTYHRRNIIIEALDLIPGVNIGDKTGDKYAPAFRDMSLGSEFLHTLNNVRDWSSKINTDNIFTIIGLTPKNYQLKKYVHLEAENHEDGIVSYSSASLLDHGIGFLGIYGNHDDGKFGAELPPVFLPILIENYFNSDYNEFKSYCLSNVHVDVFVEGDRNVVKPSNINHIYDLDHSKNDVNFQLGMVQLNHTYPNPNKLHLFEHHGSDSQIRYFLGERSPYPLTSINIGSFHRNDRFEFNYYFTPNLIPMSSKYTNCPFIWPKDEMPIRIVNSDGHFVEWQIWTKKNTEYQLIEIDTDFHPSKFYYQSTPPRYLSSFQNQDKTNANVFVDDQTSIIDFYLSSNTALYDSIPFGITLISPDGALIDSTSTDVGYVHNLETGLKILTVTDPLPGKWQVIPEFDQSASDTLDFIANGRLVSDIQALSLIGGNNFDKNTESELQGKLQVPELELLDLESLSAYLVLNNPDWTTDTLFFETYTPSDSSVVLNKNFMAPQTGDYSYRMIIEGFYNDFQFERIVYGNFKAENLAPTFSIPDQKMNIYNTYHKIRLPNFLSCPGCDDDDLEFNVSLIESTLDSTIMYYGYQDSLQTLLISIDHDAFGFAEFMVECVVSEQLTLTDTFTVSYTPEIEIRTLGTSEDAYGWGCRGGQRSLLWADDRINTISLIHRMGGPLDPDGHSGNLGYDVSKDGGKTWSIMNECWTAGVTFGGYGENVINSNHAIFNPPGNTDPDNAYITFFTSLPGFSFAGIPYYGHGVSKIGDTSYNTKNIITNSNQNDPKGFTLTQDGTAWVVDAMLDIFAGNVYQGSLNVLKGVWTEGTIDLSNQDDDFVYQSYTLECPTHNSQVPLDNQVAFAPDGQTGYIAVLSDNGSNEAFTGRAYFPILYKTTDGGETWEGPINVHLGGPNGIIQIKNFLDDEDIIDIFGELVDRDSICFTTAYDFDLVVDSLGNPHIAVVVGINTESEYAFLDTAPYFAVFSISSFDGGLSWNGIELGRPKSFRGVFDALCYEDNRVQNAIDMDGTKMFVTWQDTDPDLGSNDNNHPDIYVRGIDLPSLMQTGENNRNNAKNITRHSEGWNKAYFHSTSHYVLTESNAYKVPLAYQALSDSTDLNQYVEFKYIDNIIFWDNDFFFETAEVDYELNVAEDMYEIAYPADSLHILINSNAYWLIETSADWFDVSTISGAGTSTITINIHENIDCFDRIDSLKIRTVWGDSEIYLMIHQQGKLLAPLNLHAYDITTSGATIEWDSEGAESHWHVLYGLAGFDPEVEGVLVNNISETQYLLSGLEPGNTYDVYASSVCNDMLSAWTGPVSFTTLIYDIPENLWVSDVIITENEEVCYEALETIITGGNAHLFVEPGAQLYLVAGKNIIMLPGTHANEGSYLHARIAPGGPFCEEFEKNMLSTAVITTKEDSEIDITKIDDIIEETSSFFNVFPNPTRDKFTLELFNFDYDSNTTVEVFDMRGVLIKRMTVKSSQQHTFSLEGHLPGIYLVRVLLGEKIGIERLIKQ